MAELDWLNMHKDAMTTLEGEFPVVIVEAEATSSGNGKPMIKCKLKVEAGPAAGRVLFNNFVVSAESPGAMRMLFTHLAVLGLDANYFMRNPSAPTAQIAKDLIGRRANVEVGVRQWQGADREEIKAWKPAIGGPGGGMALGGLSSSPIGGPVAVTSTTLPVGSAPVTPSTPPPADPFA